MSAVNETSEPQDPPAGSTARPVWQRLIPLAALVSALALFFILGLDEYVSFQVLQDHRQTLVDFVAGHAVSASLLFFAIYAVAVAISFPGASIITIVGGFLFGVVWGSVLVVFAATAGATAVFLAARTALHDTLQRRAGKWVRRLEGGFRENAFSYMLTLRLIPVVPFWLVNLVPALLGVRLATYVVTTFLGIIPGTVVYVALGNGLGATLDAGQTPDLGIIFDPEILLPLIGLSVLAMVPVVYRWIRGRPPAPPPPQ
jgi:uncharacterized membrane protein YdjX (TVP38/TMEM64 family)